MQPLVGWDGGKGLGRVFQKLELGALSGSDTFGRWTW